MVNRYIRNVFDRDMAATVGAAYFPTVIVTSREEVRLQVWDTAGQEKFRALAPFYFRGTAVAILVYDVTQKQTLEGIDDWANEIATKAPSAIKLVVVGNKKDLADERVVSASDGNEASRKIRAEFHIETSAKTGEGLQELFTRIAELNLTEDLVQEHVDQKVSPPTENPNSCC
jgi:small GTP-binding protein